MAKRVLHIINGIGTGGIEKFILSMLDEVSEGDIIFDFLLRKDACSCRERIEACGGEVYILKHRFDQIWKRRKELKDFFKEHTDYDAVHIQVISIKYAMELPVVRNAGIKNIILHSHSSDCNTSRERRLHYMHRFLFGGIPTKRLACSDKAGNWMFGNQSFHIIKNGVDTEKFTYTHEKRRKIREELGIGNQTVIGHVGRMSPEKNQRFVIEVFQEYHKKHPQSVLLLLGDGKNREEVQQMVNNSPVRRHIMLLGVRDNIDEWMCAMDFFLLPSLREGFPITLVEAQSTGLFCLVSDTVTKQVQVTDLVQFDTVSGSPESWAQALENFDRKLPRETYSEVMRKSGYDIHDVAKGMISLYSEL